MVELWKFITVTLQAGAALSRALRLLGQHPTAS